MLVETAAGGLVVAEGLFVDDIIDLEVYLV